MEGLKVSTKDRNAIRSIFETVKSRDGNCLLSARTTPEQAYTGKGSRHEPLGAVSASFGFSFSSGLAAIGVLPSVFSWMHNALSEAPSRRQENACLWRQLANEKLLHLFPRNRRVRVQALERSRGILAGIVHQHVGAAGVA